LAKRYFIDLFAGCGGLSRGLIDAGFELLFAVEKSEMAAETYYKNLLGRHDEEKWRNHLALTLDQQIERGLAVAGIEDVLRERPFRSLKNKVQLLAGGPPCQGYSNAGRRDPDDPRNALPDTFLKFIEELHPELVLVENVSGMRTPRKDGRPSNFSVLATQIAERGYVVQPVELDAAAYGVPQMRKRAFLIARKKEGSQSITSNSIGGVLDLFRVSRLTGDGGKLSKCASQVDWQQENVFEQLLPKPLRRSVTAGQVLAQLNQTRQSRKNGLNNDTKRSHSLKTEERFTLYRFLQENNISRKVLFLSTLGEEYLDPILRQLREEPERLKKSVLRFKSGDRYKFDSREAVVKWLLRKKNVERFGTRKHSQRVIKKECPSPTVLTIPDDLIHPFEDRTLTVREMAALQGFKNSFIFYGKITTGGTKRRREVPQYSQVGNAVPPPLGRAIGERLIKLLGP